MTVSAGIVVGSQVWVEDPEVAWLDGEVVEVNGDEIKITTTSGKTAVANVANAYPKDPDAPPCGVDDMTKLAYLHEPGVLYNLRCRYDTNEIYTYTGNILIAVNPFQRLPHLYNNSVMEQYKGVAIGELSPHPFAIADAAYRQMVNEGISQAILVSGESGAGKTESTKMLMQYLAYMGGRVAVEGRSVEQQVLESNPVLEAFGNAKTLRNNNSSRFGKFVEIQFNNTGRISGAAIRTYLLERSRVCQVSDPERNYHCFYMLCAAPPEEIEKYKLGNPRTFHYLNQSNCYELDGVDELKEYHSTRRAMDVVGIGSDKQDAIFRVVAAILHLGNIEFAKVSESDASQPKDDQSKFHLKTAADLLMCNEESLEDSLCKRVIVTRDETITRSLDPDAAATSRDALAKIVYSRLFDWLVTTLNHSIGQDANSKHLIGVLDIYGFESFKTNSFEQFCINLTNEKLQQHFNQHVFKLEQDEYKKEEIDWSYIEFVDNQDILDLIEKKPGGIIALLDEACMFPRSTHETFATKLYQTFKDHKRFVKPKLSQTDFTICHYAGDVTYQTELFLDKNKDYVVAEHQALLSASNCSFVSGLFPPLPEESSKSSKFSSIGSQFKQQLQALLETLSATEPHYVRCVKPNNLLKPAIFENSNVLQQLRCGGVMEAIRISCAGFPTRKTFDEFKIRFKILEPSVVNGSGDAIAACRKILAKVDLKGYQIGKTKVFLRAGQMAELDSHRILVLGKSACIIQKNVRKYFARRSFVSLRLSAIQIQAFCRGQSARDIYENKRRNAAALKTQKGTRTFLARKAYTRMYSTAVLVQAGLRGMAARDELKFRRKTKAAIIIQSRFRGHVACCWYLSLKRATIAAQCACRAMKAREELRMLKLAARETGALQEAKVRLEEEVKELTSQLEMEKRMRADIEEAKNQESAKLQSALEKIELELQESAKLKSELEKMHAELQEESAKLKSELETMQLELQESTKLKSDIEKMQAELQESAKLKTDMEKMQAELQESAKLKTDMEKMQAELQESAGLKSDMEKMQAELQKSASLKSDMEKMQAELQESAGLKSDMEKMQAELQKSASLKFDMEKMQAELQKSASLKYDMETMQVELQESAKLKSDMETMQAELQESAKLKSELEKMRAELQESSELQSELEKMRAELQESAELKSELEKMRVELQETKEQLMNERVAANKVSVHVPEPGAEDAPSAQEFQETKEQPMNGIEAENKEVPDTQEFQETKEQPMNELEAANKVTVDAPGPGVQEVTVIDHGLVDKLAAENEKLKLLVSSLEKKIDETEKKYEETNKLSEDRLKQAMEAESKMILLKTQMQRVEEKLSDIETEDHILRQQALLNAPSRKMSGSGRFGLSSQPMENGDPEPQKTMKRFSSASATYDKTKSTNIERHRESVDTLVTCISKNLGFSEGKPVAAFTIYKCLVHWKSLEAERTNIFDRLIQIIGSAIEDESNMDLMAYWLSNTSTLLFLLQHTLKASSSSPKKPPQPTSFFGRMAQSFRGSSSSRKLGFEGLLRQIEAKYPALLFKQQLTAYVEKIYGIIRDNTKNELSPLLSSCIQTPTTPREDAPSSPGGSLKDSSPIGHWGSIVERLNGLLATLKNNFVPPFLVQNISQQVFSYVNSELFNSLLLRKECCTFSNGEYIKAGLDELETWCGQEHEVLGPSWEELKHVRQAVGFLVIDQKSQITYDDLTTNMCPTLSVHQLYRICTIYGDDDSNTPSVDPEVISSMKKLMTEDSDEADTDTNSYMLDDNSSIPFPVEDIGNSFRQEDFSNVKPAEELLENPAFEFLRGS